MIRVPTSRPTRRRFIAGGVLAALGSSASLDAIVRRSVGATATTIVASDVVSMVGDSLTAGSLAYQASAFGASGWSSANIDAYGSRGVSTKVAQDPHTGLTAVDSLRSTKGDTVLWVVALGTNDSGIYSTSRYAEIIDTMLDRIDDRHQVLWVNIYLPKMSARQSSWNAALDAAARARPNTLAIFDWATIASMNPGWLGADGVHYTAAGYKARSAAIAQATVGFLEPVLAALRVDAQPVSAETVGTPVSFAIVRPAQRFVDTRLVGLPFSAGETRTVDLSTIAPPGTTVVALNLTITEPESDGFSTVWRAGEARPWTKALDFAAGRSTAGHTIAGVSEAGAVSVYTSCACDVILDALGWFSPAGELRLTIVEPQRLLDTRTTAPTIANGSEVTFTVPTTGGAAPKAAWINLTVDNIESDGHLVAWPTASTRPGTSNLNFAAGDGPIANGAHVALDDQGRATVGIVGSAAVIVDLLGVYTDDATGLLFQAASPIRLLDTRDAVGGWLGRLATDQEIDVSVPARGPVVVGTLAATAGRSGYVLAWSGEGPKPDTSTLNLSNDHTVSVGVLSNLSASSTVKISTHGGGNEALIFDLSGWFVDAS